MPELREAPAPQCAHRPHPAVQAWPSGSSQPSHLLYPSWDGNGPGPPSQQPSEPAPLGSSLTLPAVLILPRDPSLIRLWSPRPLHAVVTHPSSLTLR